MPIITRPEVGDKLRYVGPVEGDVCNDVTVGRIYVIAGSDIEGEEFFYDDAGDKNYAATADGTGVFELVEDK